MFEADVDLNERDRDGNIRGGLDSLTSRNPKNPETQPKVGDVALLHDNGLMVCGVIARIDEPNQIVAYRVNWTDAQHHAETGNEHQTDTVD